MSSKCPASVGLGTSVRLGIGDLVRLGIGASVSVGIAPRRSCVALQHGAQAWRSGVSLRRGALAEAT